MDSAHTLQAVFVPTPTYKWVSGITGSQRFGFYAIYLAGPLTMGNTTVSAAEPYGVIGQINCALNAQSAGHIYVYGYGSGPVEVYTSAGYLTTLYPLVRLAG